MTKFTKEEISLCKQVAEKHRKEVEYGDWFIMPSDPHLFPTILEASPTHKLWKSEINKKAIPLWTISDCLEFLKKKKIDCELFELSSERKEGFVRVTLWKTYANDRKYWFNKNGKTPLEACLKAVLAVFEEKKK